MLLKKVLNAAKDSQNTAHVEAAAEKARPEEVTLPVPQL